MDTILIEKPNPSAEEINLISNHLKKYNKSIIGKYNTHSYLLLLYKDLAFIGGSYSEIKLGWLHIDLLWIDAAYHRQGLGTKLLLRTEELAKKRGIFYARLNTGNFQGALSFYHYHGYEIFAELEIFPENGNIKEIYIDYFMKKSFPLGIFK
jgi:GNAT superfamily N-acetyltransferase